MEYVISTEFFKKSEKFGQIYYQGNFDIEENNISILEGDLIYTTKNNFDSISNNEILKKSFIGNFNFFRYNKETNDYVIKNDKFGTNSLFIYHQKEKMIISNNVWKIIELLRDDEIIINKNYVRLYIGLWGVDLDSETLFKNISELNPATNVSGNISFLQSIKKEQYYTLSQSSIPDMSIENAVETLDKDLDFTFSRIKQNNPDSIMGFGNSGGLDSRLIPIYARQNGIQIQGLTTLNKYPKKFFKSITYINAKKIAAAYKFDNKFLNYKFKNYEDRNILDIRNNPFGPSQIFKNPYDRIPKIDYYVTGGNGFIVGGSWEKIVNLKNKSDFLSKFIMYNSKFMAFNWSKEGPRFFKFLFQDDYRKFIENYKIRFYNENSEKDNFSIIRSFHQYSLNKRSPAGGFESINKLYKTYNIYYPIVYENTLKWPESFFFGRTVLKELIRKKSKALYKIPSQNYAKLDNSPLNIIEKIERHLVLKCRNWGLDYENWVQDKSFIKYADSVMNRKNSLFFDILNVSETEFKKFNLFKDVHAHISLDILKIKKILDIIKYKEFDFISNTKFEIK